LASDKVALRQQLGMYAKRAKFVMMVGNVYVLHPEQWTDSKLLNVRLQPGVSVRQKGEKIEFQTPGGQFAISESRIREMLRAAAMPTCVAVHCAKDKVLFAVLDETGHSYPVFCLDRESAKTIWRATSWGYGSDYILAKTGAWFHDVQLAIAGNRVLIFGDGNGGYVESFQLDSGKVQMRFAANGWNLR
jgi:hypothetical protein